MWNPANIVFHPELLTPEGLRYRRRLWQSVIALIVLVLGTMVMVGLARI
jgi:hypothetical protein